MNALPIQSQNFRQTSKCLSYPVFDFVEGGSLFPAMLPEQRRRKPRRTRKSRHTGARAVQVMQQSLPFPMPVKIVTPLMQKVLDIVIRTAAARLSMPTNADLSTVLGRGRQSVAKAFDRLVALGRLRIDVKKSYRRVYVVAKQSITGWGEHRPGHAPFCRRKRGEHELDLTPPPPRSIGRGEGFSFLGISRLDEYDYRAALGSAQAPVGAARFCQFVTSPDGSYYTRYCGERSVAGKSWCGAHLRVVFS